MNLDSHRLTDIEELKSNFNRFGICHIAQLFSKEFIDRLRSESDLLWEQQSERTAKNLRIGLRQNLSGNTMLDRLDPVADISELFDQLNKEPVLVNLAESLLGQKVQVMKEKLIFKRPGTGGFGLHRDEPYFVSSGANGSEVVSITVVLDDFENQNGPVQFFPELRRQNLKAPADEPRDVDVSETLNQTPLVPLAKAGDILAFDGLLPHCSDYNYSTMPRRIYMVTYIPATYRDGRENYYRQRLVEQRQERHHKNGDESVFR